MRGNQALDFWTEGSRKKLLGRKWGELDVENQGRGTKVSPACF